MSNVIFVKTDASLERGTGMGISYVAEVTHGGTMIDKYEDSKFIQCNTNSTTAELSAFVYGVVQVTKKVDSCSEYRIVLESDCEFVIDKYEEGLKHHDERIGKTVSMLLQKYKADHARWIPRATNQRADSLAKVALMRGTEND